MWPPVSATRTRWPRRAAPAPAAACASRASTCSSAAWAMANSPGSLTGRFASTDRDGDPEAAVQGDKRVVEYLNEQLTAELTAVNQYFLHAKMQANWGYTQLA